MAVVLQGGYEVVSCLILPVKVCEVSVTKSKGLKYYALCARQKMQVKETEDSSHLGWELCAAELVVIDVSKKKM